MICIVLAAGYATRMYPLTENFPKPLLEVQGKPILDWLLEDIDQIEQVERIIIVSNHKFYGHFADWQAGRKFSKPVTLLDDGSTQNDNRVGAVRDILVALDAPGGKGQDALVIAGDNMTEFSFQGFVDSFCRKKASCVMYYHEPQMAARQKTGIITLDGEGCISSFEEKPAEPKSDLAVPPFYIYTADDLDAIPGAIEAGCPTDAPGSLARWLSEHRMVYAWPMPGRRHDIGSIEGYERVKRSFKREC